MGRIAREWATPGAIALPAVVSIVLLLSGPVPWLWWHIAVTGSALAGCTAAWILWGGTPVTIATWLVPALVLFLATLSYPTVPGSAVMYLVALFPCASSLFGPVRRAFRRYTDGLSEPLVRLTLSESDRSASAALGRAMTPNRVGQNTGMWEDPHRRAAALHALADRVRRVPLPDSEWQDIGQRVASALERGANDAGHVVSGGTLAEVRAARKSWLELLRSRSIGYRLLTHRWFTPAEDERVEDL